MPKKYFKLIIDNTNIFLVKFLRKPLTTCTERNCSMSCITHKKNAFTLVELTIFLAVIGILAALFIPPFLNYLKKVRSAEAQINIKKIVDLEIAYFKKPNFDESGIELLKKFRACPTTPSYPSSEKKKFIADKDWNELEFSPNGPVYYSYEVKTRGEGSYSEATINVRGDLDDDGVYSTYSINLYIDQETQEIKQSELIKINELE